MNRRVLISLLAAAAIATGLACKSFGGAMNTARLPASVAKMRTHCIGNLLIDLPESFDGPRGDVTLHYGFGQEFDTVQVSLPSVEDPYLSVQVAADRHVAELVASYHWSAPSKNMLANQQELSFDERLVRAYDDGLLDAFKSSLYVAKGPTVAMFLGETFLRRDPRTVEDRLIRVARATTYAADPAHAGRGACLGPLVIDAKQDNEIYTLVYLSDELPTISFDIDMSSTVKASDGLLIRRASKAGVLEALGFASGRLRSGAVTVGGRPAEELLEKGEDNGKVVRGFSAETLVKEPSTRARPQFSITMSMGGQLRRRELDASYHDAPFTDDEAIALWDAIIKSIRPRPGAV